MNHATLNNSLLWCQNEIKTQIYYPKQDFNMNVKFSIILASNFLQFGLTLTAQCAVHESTFTQSYVFSSTSIHIVSDRVEDMHPEWSFIFWDLVDISLEWPLKFLNIDKFVCQLCIIKINFASLMNVVRPYYGAIDVHSFSASKRSNRPVIR